MGRTISAILVGGAMLACTSPLLAGSAVTGVPRNDDGNLAVTGSAGGINARPKVLTGQSGAPRQAGVRSATEGGKALPREQAYGQGEDSQGYLVLLLGILSAVFIAAVAIQFPASPWHRQRT